MLIKSSRDGANPPLSSEITPREVYEERRQFIARMAIGAAAGSALWEMANRAAFAQGVSTQTPAAQKLAARANPALSTTEPRTAFKDVTSYNNYYEFGLDKGDPAENAHTLRPRPWTVSIGWRSPRCWPSARRMWLTLQATAPSFTCSFFHSSESSSALVTTRPRCSTRWHSTSNTLRCMGMTSSPRRSANASRSIWNSPNRYQPTGVL